MKPLKYSEVFVLKKNITFYLHIKFKQTNLAEIKTMKL